MEFTEHNVFRSFGQPCHLITTQPASPMFWYVVRLTNKQRSGMAQWCVMNHVAFQWAMEKELPMCTMYMEDAFPHSGWHNTRLCEKSPHTSSSWSCVHRVPSFEFIAHISGPFFSSSTCSSLRLISRLFLFAPQRYGGNPFASLFSPLLFTFKAPFRSFA